MYLKPGNYNCELHVNENCLTMHRVALFNVILSFNISLFWSSDLKLDFIVKYLYLRLDLNAQSLFYVTNKNLPRIKQI